MTERLLGGWWCSCGAHCGEVGSAARVELDGCPFCGSHRRPAHEIRRLEPGQEPPQMQWDVASYLRSGSSAEQQPVGRQRYARQRVAVPIPSELEAAATSLVGSVPEGEEGPVHYHVKLYGEESIVEAPERMEEVRAILAERGEVEVRRCTERECYLKFFGKRRGWGDRRHLRRREQNRRLRNEVRK